MVSFEVKVYQAKVEQHPNADAIELVRIGGFVSIVKKDQFKSGDLVAYIPQDSIVPEEILKELGLEGKLAGSKKNRVKPMRLRGIFSEGLIYPARSHWSLNDEISKELGIEKYEQPIPISLAGEMFSCDHSFNFDIENYKKYSHILEENEEVVFSEKLHGSFVVFLKLNEAHPEAIDSKFLVSSKGLASKGLFLKQNEKNSNNSYLRMFFKYELNKKLESLSQNNIAIVGEVLGVQDLKYDAKNDQTFRAFGVKIDNTWLDHEEFIEFCKKLDIPHVPILYKGPFSEDVLKKFTSGKTTIEGASHIREGLVITPVKEKSHPEIGRVILKSISEDYLLRKEGTEFT